MRKENTKLITAARCFFFFFFHLHTSFIIGFSVIVGIGEFMKITSVNPYDNPTFRQHFLAQFKGTNIIETTVCHGGAAVKMFCGGHKLECVFSGNICQ